VLGATFWRVHAESDLVDLSDSVTRVLAEVKLQLTGLAELRRDAARSDREIRVNLSGNPENLNLWHRWRGTPLPDDQAEATRLALVEHRVDVDDIEDGINQMLGRDPSLHRPPRLSWEKLIRSFENDGVQVTERELIAAPLTIELAPEVQAELDGAE
jgi:hypothetical protein